MACLESLSLSGLTTLTDDILLQVNLHAASSTRRRRPVAAEVGLRSIYSRTSFLPTFGLVVVRVAEMRRIVREGHKVALTVRRV